MGTQKARIWRINRGKGMLIRITDAIARSKQTLEDEGISPSEFEWTTLIDAENYLIAIKGMKGGSNDACYYKIEHGMVICDQPAYQTERLIRLLAKNGEDMMVDPKPSKIKPTTMCWSIEGHPNQLSWDPTVRTKTKDRMTEKICEEITRRKEQIDKRRNESIKISNENGYKTCNESLRLVLIRIGLGRLVCLYF